MRTDRPDQTESSVVVPPGLVQIETGFLITRDQRRNVYEAPGTLFRIGAARGLELRLGHSGMVRADGATGFGDAEIGAKVHLFEAAGWRPDVAVLGGVSLPTGETGVSSGHVDPAFRFALSHTLSDRVALGYNLGAAWESAPGESIRRKALLYTATIGLALTERVGAFLEVFGDQPVTDIGRSTSSFDGGLTILVMPTLQLDGTVGRASTTRQTTSSRVSV